MNLSKQDRLYFLLWKQACQAQGWTTANGHTTKYIDALRHAQHETALGVSKSHKDFTNSDFDLVFAHFRQLASGNTSLAAALASNPDAGERKRLIYRIHELAHPAYWRKISENKFGSIDLDTLTTEQLTQLRNTLVARQVAKKKKPLSFIASATEDATSVALCEGGSENPF